MKLGSTQRAILGVLTYDTDKPMTFSQINNALGNKYTNKALMQAIDSLFNNKGLVDKYEVDYGTRERIGFCLNENSPVAYCTPEEPKVDDYVEAVKEQAPKLVNNFAEALAEKVPEHKESIFDALQQSLRDMLNVGGGTTTQEYILRITTELVPIQKSEPIPPPPVLHGRVHTVHRNYAFLAASDGIEYFLHIDDVLNQDRLHVDDKGHHLHSGDLFTFTPVDSAKGPRAVGANVV